MSEKMTREKKRNYGIDLLRIVAICMILILHILGKDNVLVSTEVLSSKYNVAWLLEIASYCAVDCYALVSGYVGIRSKAKFSNIAMLWLQVVFYSFGGTLVFLLVSPDMVTKTILFKSMFPVMAKQYWYFTAYFGMFLLIPFLNAAVNAMPRKQLRNLLFICFIMYSVISVPLFKDSFLFNNGYSMFWLAVLYVYGAYFGKYNIFEGTSKIRLVAVYVGCVLLTWIMKLMMVFFDREGKLPFFVMNKNFLVSYMSPTILVAAIALLGIFSNLTISKFVGKIISYIGSLAFGVYLIQSQPLISKRFMTDSFAFLTDYSTAGMACGVLIIMVIIFTVCAIIDAGRQQLFKILHLKSLVIVIENKINARLEVLNGDKD